MGAGGALAIAKRRQREAIEILYLSGGGQVGAFGAGILNGWSRSGRRPQFDIVAGVSTGPVSARDDRWGNAHRRERSGTSTG